MLVNSQVEALKKRRTVTKKDGLRLKDVKPRGIEVFATIFLLLDGVVTSDNHGELPNSYSEIRKHRQISIL